VPIDGVGFQTHMRASTRLAPLGDMMRRVAALDVDVAITELDVLVPVPADALSLRQQAEVYGGAAQACLSTPRCRSITVWGFTDAVSWIPAYHFGFGAATLLDASLAAKPAYHRFACTLSGSMGGPICLGV
jgi:endo-1,4-beta-xylanase